MNEITVIVGDRYPVMRDSLAAYLTRPNVRVVGIASSADDTVALAEREKPDVAIVSYNLCLPPSGLVLGRIRQEAPVVSGLELLKRIRSASAAALVLLLDSRDGVKAAQALRSGASAIVLTTSSRLADLRQAVRWAVRGEVWISPPLLSLLLSTYQHGVSREGELTRLELLTGREREVLDLLAAGMDRTAAAAYLHLSINTIRTHLQNVLKKLDVHSTIAAVLVVRKADIPPTEFL